MKSSSPCGPTEAARVCGRWSVTQYGSLRHGSVCFTVAVSVRSEVPSLRVSPAVNTGSEYGVSQTRR